MENNVPLVITPEKLSFSHFSDQSHSDEFEWIEGIGTNHIVDTIIPDYWTTYTVRMSKDFQPVLLNTGLENEIRRIVS